MVVFLNVDNEKSCCGCIHDHYRWAELKKDGQLFTLEMINVTLLPAGIDIASMRGALQLELSWAMKVSPGFTYQWTIRNVSIAGILI